MLRTERDFDVTQVLISMAKLSYILKKYPPLVPDVSDANEFRHYLGEIIETFNDFIHAYRYIEMIAQGYRKKPSSGFGTGQVTFLEKFANKQVVTQDDLIRIANQLETLVRLIEGDEIGPDDAVIHIKGVQAKIWHEIERIQLYKNNLNDSYKFKPTSLSEHIKWNVERW